MTKEKSFICRICKQKHYTNNPVKFRCIVCGQLVCPVCHGNDKKCIDCFVETHLQDKNKDKNTDKNIYGVPSNV